MLKYAFTLKEIKPFRHKSGIYAIGYQDEIFYIGQSVDLGARLGAHRKENAFEATLEAIFKEDGNVNRSKALAMYSFINKNRENIYFLILKETKDLDKWEEYYIDLYKPRYNYKGINIPYSS